MPHLFQTNLQCHQTILTHPYLIVMSCGIKTSNFFYKLVLLPIQLGKRASEFLTHFFLGGGYIIFEMEVGAFA